MVMIKSEMINVNIRTINRYAVKSNLNIRDTYSVSYFEADSEYVNYFNTFLQFKHCAYLKMEKKSIVIIMFQIYNCSVYTGRTNTISPRGV